MNVKEEKAKKPPLPVLHGRRDSLPPLLLRRNTFTHVVYIACALLTAKFVSIIYLPVTGRSLALFLTVFAATLGAFYLIETLLRLAATRRRSGR